MILVIEDDVNKSRQISSFLRDIFPSESVETRHSYSSGLQAARTLMPSLILLDMSLPNFDGEVSSSEGGKFRSYGGRDILYQLRRRKIDTKAIVVTQYDTFSSESNAKSLETLTQELRDEFPMLFVDTVFYSASQDDWRQTLETLILGVVGK